MQRTSSVAPAREIALAKNVHAYERIELESIREFDADHLIKDEWKTGVLFLAGVESDAKCVAFDLTFALGRFQGTLPRPTKPMDSATARATPLIDEPVSISAVACSPLRSVTGYGRRITTGRSIRRRSRRQSMRCNM